MDLVVAFGLVNTVAWFANDNGAFGPARVVTTTAEDANMVHVADLNGDGLPDILCASYTDGRITWYENTDGEGTFSTGEDIANDVTGATYVFAVDVDGDGANDVVSAAYEDQDGVIALYMNDGNGTFGVGVDIGLLQGAASVVGCDLDDDGDMDLLASAQDSGYIVWYENLDGKGTFDVATTIGIDVGAVEAIAVDLDADGDLDVVAASFDGDRVMWFQNLLYDSSTMSDDTTGVMPSPAPTPGPSIASNVPVHSTGETIQWWNTGALTFCHRDQRPVYAPTGTLSLGIAECWVRAIVVSEFGVGSPTIGASKNPTEAAMIFHRRSGENPPPDASCAVTLSCSSPTFVACSRASNYV